MASQVPQMPIFVAFPEFDRWVEAWLESERGRLALWTPVLFAFGIAAWFLLPLRWHWQALIAGCAVIAGFGLLLHPDGKLARLRIVVIVSPLLIASGCALVWLRSDWTGAQPVSRPIILDVSGNVTGVERQPERGRLRVRIAPAVELEPGVGGDVRVNIADDIWQGAVWEGDWITVKARLVPPMGPNLPGGYDFARTAWFQGLSATGSALTPPTVVQRAPADTNIMTWVNSRRGQLATYIADRLDGGGGAIAATLATGDRSLIGDDDAEAMRRSGLAHLLSISGLHVSAVIAATWFLVMRVMALFPGVALRVRLPLLAAAVGALAGLVYTIFTGAAVPTVRACLAAMLVLAAMALGRNPVSLRLVAVAAFAILLFLPETLIGPSFQMSFGAITAIVALHETRWVKRLYPEKDTPFIGRIGRAVLLLFLTGFAVELALAPIALFHFKQTSLLGAFANINAIPLTTFAVMPLLALALLFDIVGLGTVFWTLCNISLDILVAIAHATSSQPGAVLSLPPIAGWPPILFAIGGLWLVIWRGRSRYAGLAAIAVATSAIALTPQPDILIASDGSDLVVMENGLAFSLHGNLGDYDLSTFAEAAGRAGDQQFKVLPLERSHFARCSPEFCRFKTDDGLAILASRNREFVPWRELIDACAASDLVVSDRNMPRACHPGWFLADRRYLKENGGLAVYVPQKRVVTVRQGRDDHGWIR